MTKRDVKKVVLAYSGGLDTSVILKWLQDTYDCEVSELVLAAACAVCRLSTVATSLSGPCCLPLPLQVVTFTADLGQVGPAANSCMQHVQSAGFASLMPANSTFVRFCLCAACPCSPVPSALMLSLTTQRACAGGGA